MRPDAFAAQYEQLFVPDEQRGWVPVGGNAADELIAAEDRDGVVVGLRDIEQRLIGRQRERVWRASLMRTRGRRIVEVIDHALANRVDHGDAIESRKRCVESRPRPIEYHRRRMMAGVDRTI